MTKDYIEKLRKYNRFQLDEIQKDWEEDEKIRMATEELTKEDLEKWIEAINNYSHSEMASLWRFAPSGHPIFDRRLPLYELFKKRFDEFGGFTPEISKDIGWDK